MASRDIQLIIRAKNEASRALNDVAAELRTLDIRQQGVKASGTQMSASVVDAARQLAQFEKVVGLTAAASDKAEASINRQRDAISATATELAAVQRQLASSRGAIGAAQTDIVDARLSGGDGQQQVAALQAAEQASRDLEAQEARLTRTLSAQQASLDSQERGFRELAATANTAQAALDTFGDETQRSSLRTAAAADSARDALQQQTTAAAEANRATSAKSFFDTEPDQSRATDASKTLLAAQLRAEEAADGTAQALRDQAAAAEEAARAASARSFFSQEPEIRAGITASKTLLAEQLRTADATERAADSQREFAAATEEASRAAKARAYFDTEPTGPVARASETIFADQLRAAEQQDAALKRLQDRVVPLAAVERRLAADTALANKAFEEQRIDAAQLKATLDGLEAEAEQARAAMSRGTRGDKALFGLRPYELTNLGYQVNDLVTQVASGTSPMQAFAQQGGQILQILPGIGAKLTSTFTNPYLLGAAAVIGTFTIALAQANEEAERLRKMEALLARAGVEAQTTAAELSAVAREIEAIGFEADEAQALISDFLLEGLNVAYLETFARAAKNTAIVTGEELPEAQRKLKEAFTGSYDAIAKLDDATGFFTQSERVLIREMFESGRAQDARRKAFLAYDNQMSDIADKSQGSWSKAVDALDASFARLLDRLGNTQPAKGVGRFFDNLLDDLATDVSRLEDLSKTALDREITRTQDRLNTGGLFGPNQVERIQLEERLTKLQERRAGLTRQQAKLEGELADEQSAAARKREGDELARIRRENELTNARTGAQRIALAGEEAYNAAVEEGHTRRVAAARREQAIEKARIEERKRAEDERKRAEQERRQREAKFAENIATQGRGQLLSTARGYMGRNEKNAGDRVVLQDLFKSAGLSIDPSVVAWCAALVNAVLAKNGLPTVDQTTPGSDLRARDFLAYGSEVAKPEPGDIVILKRGGNSAQGHVGFFTGFDKKGDVRVLGGNQSNKVSEATFRKEDVLGFRRAPSQGDVAEEQAKEDLKRLEQQREFNDQLDQENAERQRSIGFLREQAGLSGEALLDAQREQAVQETIAKAREKALKDDLDLSAERLAAIRATVEAEFDLANARERASASLDEASVLRQGLLDRLSIAEQIGDQSEIRQIEGDIAAIDKALSAAIDKAIAFYRTLGDNPEVRATIQGLENDLRNLDLDTRNRERTRVERPINEFQAQRNALIEQLQYYREIGQIAVAEQLEEQLRAVEQNLLSATDAAIQFWMAQGGPEAQAAILSLENLRNQVLAAQNEFIITAGQIENAFAGSFIDGFRTFAEVLSETRDPLDALAQGALQFAADFTRKLAEMGLEVLAFKLASQIGFGGVAEGLNGALGLGQATAAAAPLTAAGTTLNVAGSTLTAAGGMLTAAGGTVAAAGATLSAGSATATAAGATLTAAATLWTATALQIMAAAQMLIVANAAGGAGVFHGGGIAGSANRSRAVHSMWFAGAPRYHSGGVAGLKPNEVPTILERGEEVLTRSDPRHRWNIGSAEDSTRGAAQSLTQVLAIGEDQIANAMKSASGRRVILTTLEEERETVRTMLDG